MAERIPPLTPIRSGELVRYEEKKRLAEIAWAALLSNPELFLAKGSTYESQAWADAEAMYAESQARRPQE